MPTAPEETFVPLTSKSLPPNERPDVRVTVVPKANAQTLSALQQKGGLPAIPPTSASEPRVALQHEGDRVSLIRVQCTCGRTMELACVYEDAPAQPKPAPPAEPPPEAAPKPQRAAKP